MAMAVRREHIDQIEGRASSRGVWGVAAKNE